MAVGTPVSLDFNDDTNPNASYNTASVTPVANEVVIAVVHNSIASTPPGVLTVTSPGLTWTPIGDIVFNTTSTLLNRLSIAWGVGSSPSTGAINLAFTGGNQNGCSWSVFRVPGCNTTAPIVASSFQSARGDAGLTASVALNTIASSANGYIVGVGNDVNAAITPRASWTQIHDFAGTSPTKRLATQYRLGVDDDASATFGSADWAIVGIELASASAAAALDAIATLTATTSAVGFSGGEDASSLLVVVDSPRSRQSALRAARLQLYRASPGIVAAATDLDATATLAADSAANLTTGIALTATATLAADTTASFDSLTGALPDATSLLVVVDSPRSRHSALRAARLQLYQAPSPLVVTAGAALDAIATLSADTAADFDPLPPLPDTSAITVVLSNARRARSARRASRFYLGHTPLEVAAPSALDAIAILAADSAATLTTGIALSATATLAVSTSGAFDAIATIALDATATLAASTSTPALTTGIALTATATLTVFTGADFPLAGLPVDARERVEAIEWYANIGDFRVSTRDFVGPSWAIDESEWLQPGWDFREIYRASILDKSPDIDKALDNITWGFVEVGRVRLSLANLDGALDGLWGAEGAAVTMWRHDRITNVTVRELDGVLDTVSLEPGIVNVEITTQDLAALDTLVPRRLTSTTLFGETCPDVGFPIAAVLGNVDNLPLLYVTDEVPASFFLYLVGEGTLTVGTVRRNRIGETQLEDLHASEWSAYPTTLIDGSTVTVVRTPIRQSASGGGFHQLYADVSGPSNERNPAIAFGRLVNDPQWGGGLPIDVEQIMAQAVTMPAAPRLDGALGALREQRPLREILAKILMVAGGRAQFDAYRGWQVYFDVAAPTSARMVLRDDAGPGEKTLLSIGRRISPPLNERVATLRLQYAPDYVHDGAYLYTADDRDVATVGRIKILGADGPGDLIRDRSAADWIAGYMAKREYFSQDRVENAVTHEEGRRIQIGDIVRVFCPQLQIADESRRVVAVTKGSGKQRITHERYDVSGYSPSAGTLPTLRAVSTVAGVPASPLVTQDLEVGAVSQSIRAVQMFGGVPDDTPISVFGADFVDFVTATITTGGGSVQVTALAQTSIDDPANRIQSLFYYIQNQTTAAASPLFHLRIDPGTGTGAGFSIATHAEFYEEVLPAGTYTYRFRLIGSYDTGVTWQVGTGRMLVQEVKR